MRSIEEEIRREERRELIKSIPWALALAAFIAMLVYIFPVAPGFSIATLLIISPLVYLFIIHLDRCVKNGWKGKKTKSKNAIQQDKVVDNKAGKGTNHGKTSGVKHEEQSGGN